jgi:ribose transport system substrate-binding protein
MIITRRKLLLASAAGAAGLAIGRGWAAAPPLKMKSAYKVGFAQSGSKNPWRLAETASMQNEAARLGYQLICTDAGASAEKLASDVGGFIAQGVDVIFLSPREDKPLVPVILNAKKAGIPLILINRDVDHGLAAPGEDYVTYIGSDFVDEGRRVAVWLAKAVSGKAKIIEIEGATGSSPANDRKEGFEEAIKKFPDMKIVDNQSGDFARGKGREVAETSLKNHRDATAIYAHSDEMALGAITALEAAGKKPGKDVIVVSIDGEKDAVQAIVEGKLAATCECNPRFGPKAFATLQAYASGAQIPAYIKIPDGFYDSTNAKEALANAY